MMSGEDFKIEVRELHGMPELREAERLQTAVWGSDVPPETGDLLLAIQHEGGLVAGAFVEGGGLAGFLWGFRTADPHAMHSHRLAVLDEWRHYGLGTRLKWFQRSWCLERGIETVRWTYDPLRVINADLNIRRLGAMSRIYYENFYGEMGGINAGTPSDRLLVEWQLKAERVLHRLNGSLIEDHFIAAVPANRREDGRPGDERRGLDAPQVLVALPEDFGRMLSENLPLALEWRLQVRRLLKHYFERGYRITEFTRQVGPAYILERE